MIPPRYVEYRGARFPELDVEAVLRRHPQVVLVDELAHTNTPGSKNPKRWQDVQEILDAGITVISTVNIQHLEGLNDVVEQITGIEQKEKIPDEIVRAADQVELVTSHRKRCGAGLLTATSMQPNGSMPRCRTTSARAI